MTTATSSWTAFHHRGEVLRTVTDEADLRRDGMLPMHLPGVSETFRDELDLVAALQLRWHTRLAGTIDRHLGDEPVDPGTAVRDAWTATAEQLPGIRAIIDRYTEWPTTAEMERALTRAAAKERALLAGVAGRDVATRPGETVQRSAYQPGSAAFVARIKAVLAA